MAGVNENAVITTKAISTWTEGLEIQSRMRPFQFLWYGVESLRSEALGGLEPAIFSLVFVAEGVPCNGNWPGSEEGGKGVASINSRAMFKMWGMGDGYLLAHRLFILQGWE